MTTSTDLLQKARNLGIFLAIPTRSDVEGLKVGDSSIDPYGRLAEVVSVYAQQNDIKGRAFACFYVKNGDRSIISQGIKEGKLVRTLALSRYFTSAETDAIERAVNAEMEVTA